MKFTKAQLDDLGWALGEHELTRGLVVALGSLLDDYTQVRREEPTAAERVRWRGERAEIIQAGRRLAELLLVSGTTADIIEAATSPTGKSKFQQDLDARIADWEGRVIPPAKKRPTDWHRRILLFRALVICDAEGLPDSYADNGTRVMVLRWVLQVADVIDKKPVSAGSLPMIRRVYRHYRTREQWAGNRSSPLFYFYRHPDWPRTN